MKMPLNHHFRLDPQFSLIVEKNDMASETTPLTAKSGADADDHLRRLKAYQWCVAIVVWSRTAEGYMIFWMDRISFSDRSGFCYYKHVSFAVLSDCMAFKSETDSL
jgi:hypothetical protein